MPESERRSRRLGVWVLALLWVMATAAGLAAGSEGFAWPHGWAADEGLRTILLEIRLPRTVGAGSALEARASAASIMYVTSGTSIISTMPSGKLRVAKRRLPMK